MAKRPASRLLLRPSHRHVLAQTCGARSDVTSSSLSLGRWRTILGQAAKIGIEQFCLLRPCNEPTRDLVN